MSPAVEARLTAQASELAALRAEVAALQAGAPIEADIDPESGVVVQRLSDSQVLGCVVTLSSGALDALYRHEATWGEFTDDLKLAGWAPDSPCRWYAMARVVPFTPDGTRVEVEVVLTRGDFVGRRFVTDLADEPREQPRLSPAQLAEARAGGGWLGGG